MEWFWIVYNVSASICFIVTFESILRDNVARESGINSMRSLIAALILSFAPVLNVCLAVVVCIVFLKINRRRPKQILIACNIFGAYTVLLMLA